jgi:hypothetical protein
MSVIYDNLTQSTDTIAYVTGACNTDLYMNSNYVTTFGPVWMPRIYGKDLTAFEIASSGKIAITINDVHSIDISRSNWTTVSNYTNVISAYSNTSLELKANENDLTFTLDAASNNIVGNAASNITFSAKNGNFRVNTSNNLIINALSNLYFNGSASNVRFSMNQSTNNINFYAANDHITHTSNSVDIKATSNYTLNAYTGDITMNSTTSNMSFYTSNIYKLISSNAMIVNSQSNITTTSVDGKISTSAMNNDIFSYSFVNTILNTSNDYQAFITSNMLIDSTGGEVRIRSLASNIDMYAASNIGIVASNHFSLTTLSNITMASSNGNVSLSALTSNFDIFSSNNFTVTVSNNTLIQNTSNITLTSTRGAVNINSLTSNVNIYSKSNFTLLSSNDMTVQVTSNIFTQSVTGNITVKSYSNVHTIVDDSNIFMKMNVPADTIELYAASNIDFNTSNTFTITTRSNMIFNTSNYQIFNNDTITVITSNTFDVTAKSNVLMNASNVMHFTSCNIFMDASRDIGITAQSNIFFYVSSFSNAPLDPIFTVSGGRVLVRGDIELTGTLNTSNIFSTTVVQNSLTVDDKKIVVSKPVGGGTLTDGTATNSGAGLVVFGYPNGVATTLYTDSNKSLLWNYGSAGLTTLGTEGGYDTESYWELLGGSFRLTHKRLEGQNSNLREVSFAFRINNFDELELVKRFYYASSNGYITKRIARFGRVYD